jgi:hypothetical protein
MKDIVWKDLNFFEKIIFCIGWLSALNLLFWIIILIVFATGKKDNFWKKRGFKVVYVFGWINLIVILIVVFLTLFSSPTKYSY